MMASSSLSFLLFPLPHLHLAHPRLTLPGPVHLQIPPPAITATPRTNRRRPPSRLAALPRFTAPLISPQDQWGMWSALFAIAAFGVWSEERTKLGSTLSAALVSTLVGLAASSAGIVASDAPAYGVVMEYLLPMAVPLLLFKADIRRVLRSTGTLLLAFLLGSVATMIGTLVAYLLVPMRSLGHDNWKIAAALMSSYIGGDVELDIEPSAGNKQVVLQSATAIAISFAICKAASYITDVFGIRGGSLPLITAIILVLATTFPSQIGKLAPAGEAIALILMQIGLFCCPGNKWEHLERHQHIAGYLRVCFCAIGCPSRCDPRDWKAAGF